MRFTFVFSLLLSGVFLVLANDVSAEADAVGAQNIDTKRVDTIAERAMEIFNMPGVAIAIVSRDEIVHANGYGVAQVGKTDLIETDTLFAIASNTKAMTALGLAILVDEERLSWNTRVTDIIPEFRLYDAYVTREFRIRDLLIHQSGLGPYAGDLMFWPETDFTINEVIKGMEFLPQESGFRSQYAYDNLLYGVAGEVISRVSGMSWEAFLETRIFQPAGMKNCFASQTRAPVANRALPHVEVEGVLTVETPKDLGAVKAAGSVICDVQSVANWLQLMLRQGRTSDDDMIVTQTQFLELIKPRTFLNTPDSYRDLFGTNFHTYALGWRVTDVDGERLIHHTGGLVGMFTATAFLPDSGIGIVVLTNQQSRQGRDALVASLVKLFTNDEEEDLLGYFDAKQERLEDLYAVEEDQVSLSIADAGDPPLPLDQYVGTYKDDWRGDAYIYREGENLTLEFSRTKYMSGPLEHYSNGVFVVRWLDRRLQADAFVKFETDFDGNPVGMRMRPVSKRTDPSFDFENLNFKKQPHN